MAKPLILSAAERIGVLRRLDRRHSWTTLDDRRLCLGCGKLIRGWDILVVRSMGGVGPLRLRCPSEDCVAGPLNWVWPNRAGSAEMNHDAHTHAQGEATPQSA